MRDATNNAANNIREALERDGLTPAGRCEDDDRENTREFLRDHPWLNRAISNDELDRYVANGHRQIYPTPSEPLPHEVERRAEIQDELDTLNVAIRRGTIDGELLNQITRRRDALYTQTLQWINRERLCV